MKTILAVAVAAISAAAAGLAFAAQDLAPFQQRTEKIGLQGRKGESLLRPGFAVGEYVGGATSVGRSVNLAGFHTSDKAKVSFNVSAPSLGATVNGACAGGESRTGLGWITFDRDPLTYACSFSGTPTADAASFRLALSKGSFMARLQQPQRAGEMTWNGRTYRAQTRQVGGMPWGGGRVMGYVFSRDGVDVGGLDLNGIRPTFYLPPKGDPDRDAVAVMALSLFFFQDPANKID